MNKVERQAFIQGLDGVLAAQQGPIKCEATDMLQLYSASTATLQQNTADPNALLQRAKARAFLGELSLALEDLERCPDTAERSMQRSQCLSYMGRGVAVDADQAEQTKLSGNRLFGERDYKGAAEQYLKALQFDPTNFKVLNNLAACYLNMGDLSSAVLYSGRSVWHSEQQGTPFLKAYTRKADCLVQLRQHRWACDPLQAALRLLRRPPPPLLNPNADREREAGNALYRAGDWAEAAARYGLAIGHEGVRAPTSALLYANRSASYLLKGLAKIVDGLADAEMATRLQPEYPMGYLRKAEFLILKEDYEKAVEVLRLGIKMCDR